MADKRELVIYKGEEFKLCVRNRIERTDIFYDQYLDAARMLDAILARQDDSLSSQSKKWYVTESENNIIAFCGERGEGKSSAMISFVKAVYECSDDRNSPIFMDCENVSSTCFAEPVVIDPSMLDEVHNVLDIVLAALYKKFKDKYDNDNQSIRDYRREELLDCFQRVYKFISLINNQDKMLDDEYDYEGNISKLSKLGQSTGLREDLWELVRMYISVMSNGKNEKRKSGCLLIAIDDLDLCSFHAYKMAEQIRKYLIIPNVVIVMALKIEQLKLCVQEQNLRDYGKMMHIKEEEGEIFEEVSNMSERYVAKLIPKVRRNYLPNVQNMCNVKILYKDGSDNEILNVSLGDSVNKAILDLVYRKTGMKFLPDNLRDTVNLIVLLADMEEPKEDGHIYYENILKFSRYYERQWLFSNLNLEEYKKIQRLFHAQAQLHERASYLLFSRYTATEKKLIANPVQFWAEKNDSFFVARNWMESYRMNVFGEEEKKYVYVFQVLYTIRLNELLRLERYEEFINFIGGYVWAGNFQNVLPYVQGSGVDRSRFELHTFSTFNIIAKRLFGESILLPTFPNVLYSQYYVTEIPENDENKKAKILTWLLLGMFSNNWYLNPAYQLVYAFDTARIIASNHSICQKLHISMENYIVSLCNLESIYKKVNMEYLGISIDEFRSVIKGIENSNKKIIEAFRKLVSNIDLTMEFKEYCSKRKDIKTSGNKDDIGKTREAVSVFFRSTEDFLRIHLGIEITGLECLQLEFDSGIDKIDICDIYALLVHGGVVDEIARKEENAEGQDKGEMVKSFASKLRNRTEPGLSLERVSSYLITKTAKNAKENMDSLASNIQRFYTIHGEEKLEEAEITSLCIFYGKILDIYLQNPTENISDDLSEEYKSLVKKYVRTCQ